MKKLIYAFSVFAVILDLHSIALAQIPSEMPDIFASYSTSRVRVLIVPGHDNDRGSGGSEYKGIREADLTLDAAEALYKIFSTDKRFEVFITRDEAGLKEPFALNLLEMDEIVAFRDEKKTKMAELIANGVIKYIPSSIIGPNATEKNSIKLYAINKWVNENNIDVVLHLHFNDYGTRLWFLPGKYSGLTVFIPERQLAGYNSTLPIASAVFRELSKYFPVSNQPREMAGIIEDQELISTGANLSLNPDVASMLIEYGYIYEAQWINPATRPLIMKELAYQTYAGIKKYFDLSYSVRGESSLPYIWHRGINKGEKDPDILALQIALTRDGLYPPAIFLRNDCPISGKFGQCTRAAITNFQIKYKLPRSGALDSLTIRKVNEVYKYTLPELAEEFEVESAQVESRLWNRNLYYGLQNDEEVMRLQEVLTKEGLYAGPINGNYFDSTKSAVVAFQRRYHFGPDMQTGNVGPATRVLLSTLYK